MVSFVDDGSGSLVGAAALRAQSPSGLGSTGTAAARARRARILSSTAATGGGGGSGATTGSAGRGGVAVPITSSSPESSESSNVVRARRGAGTVPRSGAGGGGWSSSPARSAAGSAPVGPGPSGPPLKAGSPSIPREGGGPCSAGAPSALRDIPTSSVSPETGGPGGAVLTLSRTRLWGSQGGEGSVGLRESLWEGATSVTRLCRSLVTPGVVLVRRRRRLARSAVGTSAGGSQHTGKPAACTSLSSCWSSSSEGAGGGQGCGWAVGERWWPEATEARGRAEDIATSCASTSVAVRPAEGKNVCGTCGEGSRRPTARWP